MAKQAGKGDKWWLTLLVAILPSLVAGWFSLRAIDKANESSAKAEKTAGELTVAYSLMKQALEVVQHEADAGREALQKNNELLVKLLERRSKRPDPAAEVAMLDEARALNARLLGQPPAEKRPVFPPSLPELVPQK